MIIKKKPEIKKHTDVTSKTPKKNTEKKPLPSSEKNLKPLYIAMIIDKSGSMSSLSQSTVDGFNEYISAQQRDAKEATVSVTLFDNKQIMLHENKNIMDIPKLDVPTYQQYGMGTTALNDAIGSTIMSMEQFKEIKNRRVLIVVMTDGAENASIEWNRQSIADLRAKKEAEGWMFVFFGQNESAMAESRHIGVPIMRSVVYNGNDAGTRNAFSRLSRATTMYNSNADEKTWTNALHEEKDQNIIAKDPKNIPNIFMGSKSKT